MVALFFDRKTLLLEESSPESCDWESQIPGGENIEIGEHLCSFKKVSSPLNVFYHRRDASEP